MTKLIAIQYGRLKYDDDIKCNIKEVPAHFDKKELKLDEKEYSMHTEYAAGIRKFDSNLLDGLNKIKNSHKGNIPLLWVDEDWVHEFVEFIKRLINQNKHPKIIEIHPPFRYKDYDMNTFISLYKIFEKEISKLYPDIKIFIENRFGCRNGSMKFLISNNDDLKLLSELIDNNNLKLRFVLDLPQLFSSYNLNPGKFSKVNICKTLDEIKYYSNNIVGIHLWGRKKIPHFGNLDDYFQEEEIKKIFLNKLKELLGDEIPRYFVPEVNSGKNDFDKIMADLKQVGFEFI